MTNLKKKTQATHEVIRFLNGFFKAGGGDALPEIINIDFADFLEYKDDWILWRALGHTNEAGSWVAPISFLEAQRIPDRMLNIFFTLDDMLGRLQRQKEKQRSKK